MNLNYILVNYCHSMTKEYQQLYNIGNTKSHALCIGAMPLEVTLIHDKMLDIVEQMRDGTWTSITYADRIPFGSSSPRTNLSFSHFLHHFPEQEVGQELAKFNDLLIMNNFSFKPDNQNEVPDELSLTGEEMDTLLNQTINHVTSTEEPLDEDEMELLNTVSSGLNNNYLPNTPHNINHPHEIALTQEKMQALEHEPQELSFDDEEIAALTIEVACLSYFFNFLLYFHFFIFLFTSSFIYFY